MNNILVSTELGLQANSTRVLNQFFRSVLENSLT